MTGFPDVSLTEHFSGTPLHRAIHQIQKILIFPRKNNEFALEVVLGWCAYLQLEVELHLDVFGQPLYFLPGDSLVRASEFGGAVCWVLGVMDF